MTTPKHRRPARARNPVQLALIASPKRNTGRHISDAVKRQRDRLQQIRDEIADSLRGLPRYY